MEIRNYIEGEEDVLWAIFYNTIHNVNIKDYSESQVSAWAPVDFDRKLWVNKIRSINPVLVEHEGKILGYSDLQPSGLIDHFYCHHQWQRKGVGSMLLNWIYDEAKRLQITTLFSEVSITAKPFYLSQGFSVVQKQHLSIRGQKLVNYKMQKAIV